MSQQFPATVFADAYGHVAGFSYVGVEDAKRTGSIAAGLRETAGALVCVWGAVERRFPRPLDRRRWHFNVQRGWWQATA